MCGFSSVVKCRKVWYRNMNQKDEMKKNLIEEINSYYDHYVYMADVMKVYEHIEHFANYESDKLKIAPNFFKIVHASTIDSFMLTFARLYDNSEQTKSIQNLIDKCRKNISLFSDADAVSKKLIEFEDKMMNDEYISPAINTIKHRRDKIFVHNDKKFFNHPEKDSSYLPMYQLWVLRDFTKEVLTYLLEALGGKPVKETIYNNEELEKLFDKCK